MGEYINQMLEKSMPALLAGDRERIKEISEIDDKVDVLYSEIVTYLGKVGRKQLTDSQSQTLSALLSAANDLESIGDIIETDTVNLVEHCIASDVRIGEATKSVLSNLHHTISQSVDRAMNSVARNDVKSAQNVIGMKNAVQTQVADAEQHQAQRLVADAPNRIATYSVEMEVIEKLKRIYYFAKRMAKTVELSAVPVTEQAA
jgi:phosphate:Na+ symporter